MVKSVKSLRVDPDLWKRAEVCAKEQDMTTSAFVERVLIEALAERNTPEAPRETKAERARKAVEAPAIADVPEPIPFKPDLSMVPYAHEVERKPMPKRITGPSARKWMVK